MHMKQPVVPASFVKNTILYRIAFAHLSKINWPGTSLVAQWLRICLPMQSRVFLTLLTTVNILLNHFKVT